MMHVLYYRLSETSCFPIMKSWLRARFKLFVFYWKNNVIFHWLIFICKRFVFRVKCEEWQVGCHRLFGGLYRCNFHFNFTQCNMIFIIVIFYLFLKYYDVNLVYLVIYLRRINWRWRRRRFVLFVTYTIIQSITSSEMCSLHLTHPRAQTPGAVRSRHSGARGAVGGSVPCSRVSPQSWTIPARAEIRTHNLGLQVRRSIH